MMAPAKLVSILFLPLGLALFACSTSEFGGGSDKQETNLRPEAPQKNGDDTSSQVETDIASGETVPNHDGAEKFENHSDADAKGHEVDIEVAEGCRLPKNVKSTIAATKDRSGGKGIFGLIGWGGGGGTAAKMELNNLDIRDCSWFEKIKGDPNVKFAYVFQKRGLGLQSGVQSYVEPAFNVSNQRICINKASDVTRAVGAVEAGNLQCALIPRDKTGQFIAN